MAEKTNVPVFKSMAELRYQIRGCVRFGETAARQAGIEPQQHQLILAVRGLPDDLKPTIGVLAERMQLQHHSTVELIDRLVDRGFLCRLRSTGDRRQVLIKLTHDGEKVLQSLSLHHLEELQTTGPTFVKILQNLIQQNEVRVSPAEASPTTNLETTLKQRKETKHG